MTRRIALVLVLVSLLSLLGIASKTEPLAVGAKAPTPAAVDENGQPVDFAQIYAQGLTLVYFYPMASTPGCTAQACSLRDALNDLKNAGVTVIGVSHDKPAAQKKFKENNRLPFTLVADREGEVIKAFGVPTYLFGISKRQSFLIKDGHVAWRALSAQTSTHADEVRQAAAALK
ncbi:MAG TPA: peroxiredoxin [Chthoniobacteraceae bacterium]|jgi:peroxiredoxin Q/BCP|nr:peroxiredoxin [Chthoniobacteraceae bacterium]